MSLQQEMKNEPTETIATAAQASRARLRLALVVSHPIQHFCPMYRSITTDGRVELLVVFAESGAEPRFDSGFGRVIKWQNDILNGFSYTVVGGTGANRSQGVLEKLNGFVPDVVYVHGYAKDYLRAVMRWARKLQIPVMMTSDSELLHRRPWGVKAIKRITLPRVLQAVDLFLTVGDENERYFRHYGASPERFHRVQFSIDSSYYEKVLADKSAVRKNLRRRLCIGDESVVILTVGKLIPRKRQADLLRAFSKAQKSGCKPAVLLIAGDGPDRTELEEIAQPLGNTVRLLGFIGVDVLPEHYAAADIYVHPSSFDPHPLAISEALYCGLPVVVSDRVGSRGPTDDVQVGRNGWVYPSGDANALSAILCELINNPILRESAGLASQVIGADHAAHRCATLFVDGALRARENHRKD
jgi:glycosyltransferase involved in cell wall biosynthesis